MNVSQVFFHIAGLLMPALGMAVCMPWVGRVVMGPGGPAWFKRTLVHALVGAVVLVTGLVLQDHDGRMATYAALVVVAGSLEWVMHRGWRRA